MWRLRIITKTAQPRQGSPGKGWSDDQPRKTGAHEQEVSETVMATGILETKWQSLLERSIPGLWRTQYAAWSRSKTSNCPSLKGTFLMHVKITRDEGGQVASWTWHRMHCSIATSRQRSKLAIKLSTLSTVNKMAILINTVQLPLYIQWKRRKPIPDNPIVLFNEIVRIPDVIYSPDSENHSNRIMYIGR
jgi:hypothetical protein